MSADLAIVDAPRPIAASIPVAVPAETTSRHLPALARRELSKGLALVAMSGIGALASVLRLVRLDAVGFNSDEAVYAGQAASIASAPEFMPYFPVFRAHPLLFQSILSLAYRSEVSDVVGRAISAAFGVATVVVVYLLSTLLYGRRAGIAAALFLAVMPYHVIVTRQVLLDGPMVFFSTLALYLLARFAVSGRGIWLASAGGALGLAILTKETSILLVGGVYAFFALAPAVRVRVRHLATSMFVLVVVVAAFPLTLKLSGRTSTGEQFLAWQLFRRPNHGLTFYPAIVPPAVGPLLIVVALGGMWWLRRSAAWREVLLGSWATVPIVFFEIWPVKGFQYLLPAAPVVAVIGARVLDVVCLRYVRPDKATVAMAGVAALVAATLAVPAWQRIQPSKTGSFLAGSGGVPGGREAGLWMADHVPEGARIVAIGPSMANILQFYGHRKAFGLSVSPNPLHRNPVYEPLANPDLLIRSNEVQYVVWDSFSASRTKFFSQKLLRYAERYNGRAVHTESVTITDSQGRAVRKPVIIVYEVNP